jgi:hypothetical protein
MGCKEEGPALVDAAGQSVASFGKQDNRHIAITLAVGGCWKTVFTSRAIAQKTRSAADDRTGSHFG